VSAWFIAPSPRPEAALRVFAVPHAGRGASLFYPWHAMLPRWMEMVAVQLPGREGRLSETGWTRIDPIIATLAAEIRPRLDRPYVLFGHSMGALICYELARRLRDLRAPPPLALVLSGRHAPTVAHRAPPLHPLSDGEFIAAMQARYDGIPRAVLEQPDLLTLLLPTLRRDIEAMETYRFRPGERFAMPFFLYGGRDDRQAAPDGLAGWRELTTGPTSLRLFPGGHFYLQDDRAPVIAALTDDLRPFAWDGMAPATTASATAS
jgi:medium-chain acyl-[acyl-carrier-protein] hydrolase